MTEKRVVLPVFPGVELLDFCGPYEVLSACRLDESRRREEASPFVLQLAAESMTPVACANGPRFLPDVLFSACPPPDILIVPGGWGVRTQIDNAVLVDWIRTAASRASLVASVCTGSMLLGKAGLLDGRRATTHWRSLQWMRESFPDVTVEAEQHVVEDGRILTSAGIAAGIDLALHLVARCYGGTIARATARHMEYAYGDDNRRRV